MRFYFNRAEIEIHDGVTLYLVPSSEHELFLIFLSFSIMPQSLHIYKEALIGTFQISSYFKQNKPPHDVCKEWSTTEFIQCIRESMVQNLTANPKVDCVPLQIWKFTKIEAPHLKVQSNSATVRYILIQYDKSCLFRYSSIQLDIVIQSC